MWTFYAPDVSPSMGTSLPADPVDGQEFTLVDSMSAPTYSWKLRYVSAKASNKWVFVGGSPLQAEVATAETTSSTAYAALSTAGPSVAVPVAGNYTVRHGATVRQTAAANIAGAMSYDIGATGAVDADYASGFCHSGTTNLVTFSRDKAQTGLTAVTLTSKYKVLAAGTVEFKNRWLAITPIAIGG